jgi:hypothetical protein
MATEQLMPGTYYVNVYPLEVGEDGREITYFGNQYVVTAINDDFPGQNKAVLTLRKKHSQGPKRLRLIVEPSPRVRRNEV